MVDVHSTQDLPLVQNRSGSQAMENTTAKWLRTGSATGVVLTQISLQSSVGTLEPHSEGIAEFDHVIPNCIWDCGIRSRGSQFTYVTRFELMQLHQYSLFSTTVEW